MRHTRLLPVFLAALLTACGGGRVTPPPIAQPSTKPATVGKPALPPTKTLREGSLLRLDYEGFTVWMDCKERAAVKFRYNAQHDTGREPRAEE